MAEITFRQLLPQWCYTLAAAWLSIAALCTGTTLQAVTLEELAYSRPAADLFPGAKHIEPLLDLPGFAEALSDGERIGVIFLNTAVVSAVGYAGKPIHVLIGMDNDGVVRKAELIKHHESIFLAGVSEVRVAHFIGSYVGLDLVALVRGKARDASYDGISGATVTVRVIDDSIVRAAVRVARSFGLGGLKPPRRRVRRDAATIDRSQITNRSWEALVGDGSVRRLSLNYGDIAAAFEQAGKKEAALIPPGKTEGDTFIDLYVALVSVPTIGRSLLGEAEDRNLTASLAPGQHAVLLTGHGDYSFKGSTENVFDRFEIIQGDTVIRFRKPDHQGLRTIAADGAPEFPDVDVFRIPEYARFDPTAEWRLQLLVNLPVGAVKKAFVTFDMVYTLPDSYLRRPARSPTPSAVRDVAIDDLLGDEPLWRILWAEKIWQIGVLLVALTVLTIAFFFQNSLARRPRILARFRVCFLLFTLFGIGWFANAQLSVVNLLTVFNAIVTGFDWGYFLMEPLIFILWGGVVAGLLFWGRGAYCGWLCPFGALQELLNKLARLVKIPQIRVPWALHERLWALKYVIFLVLFGVSLHSLALAEWLAEVEPFKTAIIMKFVRHWPYVLFALVILAPGLFIERFYCRYLCPLGAALAIPARMRMFEWLKRYRECGNPCQQCSNSCMVQSIHPEGHINPNECIYCLHCQQLYFDDERCPVVVDKRLKKERQANRVSPRTKELAEKVFAELRRDREQQRAREET